MCTIFQHPETVNSKKIDRVLPVSSLILVFSFLILNEFYPFQIEGCVSLMRKRGVKWEVHPFPTRTQLMTPSLPFLIITMGLSPPDSVLKLPSLLQPLCFVFASVSPSLSSSTPCVTESLRSHLSPWRYPLICHHQNLL